LHHILYSIKEFLVETQENKLEQAVENKETVAKQNENQAQDGTHFEHIKDTLELLYKTFPKVFVKDGDARPLKIGIFEELKAKVADMEELSVSKVRAALRLYTSRLKYLYSVKEGVPRIDIEGNECGDTVSVEHANYAKERIKEINSKRKVTKPVAKKDGAKKTFVKKPNQKFANKKPFKIEGEKATLESLVSGAEVLVLSSEKHFVRGVVAQNAVKDNVYVTLKSGLTVNLPLDRVLLPKKAK
jgi:ProP effector